MFHRFLANLYKLCVYMCVSVSGCARACVCMCVYVNNEYICTCKHLYIDVYMLAYI